jgi:hypothetical protein
MSKTLFDDFENNWQKEWKDMPEFIQDKKEDCYSKITIRFENKNDLESFSELIKQKLTNKTKSIWFPQIQRGLNANKIYVDES